MSPRALSKFSSSSRSCGGRAVSVAAPLGLLVADTRSAPASHRWRGRCDAAGGGEGRVGSDRRAQRQKRGTPGTDPKIPRYYHDLVGHRASHALASAGVRKGCCKFKGDQATLRLRERRTCCARMRAAEACCRRFGSVLAQRGLGGHCRVEWACAAELLTCGFCATETPHRSGTPTGQISLPLKFTTFQSPLAQLGKQLAAHTPHTAAGAAEDRHTVDR